MDDALVEHEDLWNEAIDEIFFSDRYDELELIPQVGLVPLEEDPGSGLWEFYLWESGAPPERA